MPPQTLASPKPKAEARANPARVTAIAPITVPKKSRSSKPSSSPLR